MDKPIASVVMVVRSVDRFLAESIKSVLGQTFDEFEFIILDFGSTDKTQEIASRYAASDSRIRLHAIPNCSLAEARNAACFLAQGRYIAVMDADDVSLPNRLEWEIEFMEKHPEVGLVGGAAQWINADGKLLWVLDFPTEAHEINSALLTHFPFCHTAALMRREAFELVGGYRAVFTQSHDYDLCLRISEHFRCANLRQSVVKYRIHSHQVSMSSRKRQTLCKLAAQVSASSRRTRNFDPFDSVKEITPEALAELGVTHARQQADLFLDCRRWIANMSAAGETSGTLQATIETLQSDWECVERSEIADLQLTAARLYWRERQFSRGLLAVCQAVVTQPLVAGRLGKALLRRVVGTANA